MNCERIVRLLALVDSDARIDRRRLLEHLEECADCASRFPEVLVLTRQAPVGHRGRRASRWLFAAAAALLVLAAGSLLGIDRAPLAPRPVAAAERAAGRVRVFPGSVSRLATRTIFFQPERAVTTMLLERTWIPNHDHFSR